MGKKKHRKLFPLLATDPRKTLNCSLGVCDPFCPYNCYREPDYYTISPRSSPHPITVSSPSPSIFAVYQPSQNASPSSFDAITIIAVTGAVLAVLLTGFFFVAKFVSNSVDRENQRQYESNGDAENDTEEEEYQDREQVDHPIWLIRTTGLQQSIINSITICNYKRGDGLIERTDCPVCLNEFEEEECLRLLPKCNHAFHISCIDTWLKSHTNCPLCRAGIAISAASPRISAPVNVIPGGSGSNFRNDRVGEDVDHGEIMNRESDERGFKEGSNSSSKDSDVKIEISTFLDFVDCDGSETETKERVKVLGECMESNGGDSSTDSLPRAKTQIENVDFAGESCENQNQGLTRTIGDEASCSEDRGSSQSDKAAESSSVSCFNKNKSSVFPL